MRRPTFLAMVLSAAFAPVAFATGDGSLTVGDIVRGLKAREAAIRNFSVKAEFRVKKRSRYTGRVLESADVVSMCVDNASGRFWYHKVGQVYNAPGELHGGQEFFADVEETMAFDGERTRQLTVLMQPVGALTADAPAKERPPETNRPAALVGTIYPKKEESWVVDPREFTTTFMHDSITKPLGEAPVCEVLGPDGTDGLILVECRGPEGAAASEMDLQGRERFWVDVGKGMIAARRELLNLRRGEAKWITSFASRYEDLYEVEKGIWVPRKYWELSNVIAPGRAPELFREISATLSDWAVNEELPPSRFKVVFPEGTLVRDGALGRTYIAKAVTDRSVKAAAEASQNMRDSFLKIRPAATSEPGSSRWSLALGSLAAAAVIGLAIKAALHLRNRRVVRGGK